MPQRFFRSPDGASWAADDPSPAVIARYPAGTVEVAQAVPVAASVPTLAERREAAVLDREAFAEAVAEAGWIGWADAAQWSAGNALPAVERAALDAEPDAAKRDRLLFDMLGRRSVRRNAPALEAMRLVRGKTHAEVDALFGLA